jgi:hypothetical protein
MTAPTQAATVTGSAHDISNQGLNSKLLFTPATNVLLTANGLSAGPPTTIDAVNGQFTLVLEAGDYTVSFPLIPWRKPFTISVFETNDTVNITNLLSAPNTYTYTNNLNWRTSGTNIYFNGGNVGIGVFNPAAPLEIQFDSGGESPKQLLLSATNESSVVGLEFKTPNAAFNWQLGIFGDTFKIGKAGVGNFLALDADGSLVVAGLAISSGNAYVNNDGSASFLNGKVALGDGFLLHLRNDSVEPLPTQLLLESIEEGAVGIQLQSPSSTNNWHASLAGDAFKIGKADVADYVIVNPAGVLSAPQGYAVGVALGISTNLAVLLPGPKTNTLVFTKGILTQIQ